MNPVFAATIFSFDLKSLIKFVEHYQKFRRLKYNDWRVNSIKSYPQLFLESKCSKSIKL